MLAFVKYTRDLDQLRKTSFVDVVPEFKEFFSDSLQVDAASHLTENAHG